MCFNIFVAAFTDSLYATGDQHSVENLSDASLDEILDSANIFSDPESEWEVDKNQEEIEEPKSPDSRPEVDQPSTNLVQQQL